MVWGLGFGIVWGLGLRACDLGFRVWGLGSWDGLGDGGHLVG